LKVFLSSDEYYPWIDIAVVPGWGDIEVEMSQEEFAELSHMRSTSLAYQERLRKLHPEWKNED